MHLYTLYITHFKNTKDFWLHAVWYEDRAIQHLTFSMSQEVKNFFPMRNALDRSYRDCLLRVADEDRKVNLCKLCHDFPYLNHCNSIVSLEILANSIPTGNRELLGVIFFLSPVILPFNRDNIPFQLASQPKRFQFVLRADDKTSSHSWRRTIYFILG